MKRLTVALLVLGLACLGWLRPSDQLPDLVITSVTFEPERITTPADVQVHVVIENRGSAPCSGGLEIGVDARGPGGWQFGVVAYVGQVPAPGESIAGYAWIDDVPHPGTYLVMVDVDPFNCVLESNEANNSKAAKFIAY